MREVPLPTQDCCCHRVAVLAEGLDESHWSVVVSQLASSQLTQVKLDKMDFGAFCLQHRSRDADGFEVRKYTLDPGSMNQSKKVKGFDASAFEAKQTKNADGVMEHGGMFMVGEPMVYEGVQISSGSFAAILGQGIWLGSCDFEKGVMDIDMGMGKEFVTEEEMYDHELYPTTAPRPDPVTGLFPIAAPAAPAEQ